MARMVAVETKEGAMVAWRVDHWAAMAGVEKKEVEAKEGMAAAKAVEMEVAMEEERMLGPPRPRAGQSCRSCRKSRLSTTCSRFPYGRSSWDRYGRGHCSSRCACHCSLEARHSRQRKARSRCGG